MHQADQAAARDADRARLAERAARRRRWARCLALPVIPFLLLAAFWCLGTFESSPDLAEISGLTDITFPPGTKMVESRLVRTLSPTAWLMARLAVPEAKVADLLNGVAADPVDRAVADKVGLRNHWTKPRWWQPDSVSPSLAFRMLGPNGFPDIRLLVGTESSEGMVDAYLYVRDLPVGT